MGNQKLTSLSFVFPMYNEIENIKPCIEGAIYIGEKLGIDFEIVVVNDASTDGCEKLAEEMAKTIPQIKVLHHEKNRKLGGTLRTGFYGATKDYILYMDSDLPLDFDDVAEAIPKIGDFDILIGYRLTRDESIKRKILSTGYNLLIRTLFGLQAKDVNFSFKLFKREILEKISLKSEGSFIDAELLIEARRAGYQMTQVGLPYHPRIAGESTLASTSVIQKTFEEMGTYFFRQK